MNAIARVHYLLIVYYPGFYLKKYVLVYLGTASTGLALNKAGVADLKRTSCPRGL